MPMKLVQCCYKPFLPMIPTFIVLIELILFRKFDFVERCEWNIEV